MKRNLRKAFAFILALTMVVSLFACGKKDANPDGGDSSSDDIPLCLRWQSRTN